MKRLKYQAKSHKVHKIRLKKGDQVVVLRGALKGKTGKISATHPRTNMVTIDGLKVVKRHKKPNRLNQTGGVKDINIPISVSKVSLVEPKSKRPSRLGIKIDVKSGNKTRIFRRSGQEVKV